MSEPNMSVAADWYCTKARVAHFVGRDDNVGEIKDFTMDTAYKWVNGQLRKEDITPSDATVKTLLQADADVEMAQVWMACDLMTTVISANQHHGRIVPDGKIASQTYSQGEIGTTYHEPKPTEHYKEMGPPDFYMRAQRAIERFLNALDDEFKRTKKSLIARKNTLMSEGETDFANRLYSRYRGT